MRTGLIVIGDCTQLPLLRKPFPNFQLCCPACHCDCRWAQTLSWSLSLSFWNLKFILCLVNFCPYLGWKLISSLTAFLCQVSSLCHCSMGLTNITYTMVLSFICCLAIWFIAVFPLKTKFYEGQDQVCYLRSLVFPGLQCLDKMCPEIYEWMSEMINIDEWHSLCFPVVPTRSLLPPVYCLLSST